MSDVNKTYTVVIDKELIEVQASRPIAAAVLAVASRRSDRFLEDEGNMGLFIEVAVFEGKAPGCIYHACGIYSV